MLEYRVIEGVLVLINVMFYDWLLVRKPKFIDKQINSPFDAQYNSQVNRCTQHDVHHWVDEIWIKHRVDHSVELKCPCKCVVCH